MDRNNAMQVIVIVMDTSLSARRAWIEIIDYIIDYVTDASLSARRAWIEMTNSKNRKRRSESRSPQGERG